MGVLLLTLVSVILITLPLILLRLRIILNRKRIRPTRHGRQNPDETTHLLIVLGSGGHTAEMIAMLERAVSEEAVTRRLDWKDYTHRTWVVGSGDGISAVRAREFEETAIQLSTQNDELEDDASKPATTSVVVMVPRARRIHQSILTAPISSLRCMIACCVVLLQHASGTRGFPDLILCNGPATATILVFTSVLLRLLNVKNCETNGKMRTIYIESWARVKRLSLSGRLLSLVVDRFLVQWPQLEKKYGGRVEYLGVLI